MQKAYKEFDEELETWDEFEEDRLEHLALAKARGKGAPKKKKSADGMSFCLFCVWEEGKGFAKGIANNGCLYRVEEDQGKEEAASCCGFHSVITSNE